MELRYLSVDDLGLIASIDRSEHVDVEFHVVGGELRKRPVTRADIPVWDREGTGPFSVAHQIEFCAGVLRQVGAVLLGAFDDDHVLGVAVVDPVFAPGMAWLAFLHVSRPSRRRGAATALWNEAAAAARASGAETLYVSAVPTGSAVGFYLQQGCQLADPVHPGLWAKEPEDIHLTYRLR